MSITQQVLISVEVAFRLVPQARFVLTRANGRFPRKRRLSRSRVPFAQQ